MQPYVGLLGKFTFHHDGIFFPDGPPLPVGEQLRGLHELQVLHPLPALRPPLLRLLRALLAQVLPRVLVVHRAQGEQRQWKVGITTHKLIFFPKTILLKLWFHARLTGFLLDFFMPGLEPLDQVSKWWHNLALLPVICHGQKCYLPIKNQLKF